MNPRNIKAHLDGVTADAITAFQANTLTEFAKIYVNDVRIVLGINAFSQFVVLHGNDKFVFATAQEAIDKYEDLVYRG